SSVLSARPPLTPPFPYTTLFRSALADPAAVTQRHQQAHFQLVRVDEPHQRRAAGHVLAGTAQPLGDDAIEHRAHFGAPQLVLDRSEEHTSELQSRENLVCRLLLE